MSGFDVIIYIAGLILLTKLFMKELLGIVQLGRRVLTAARDPNPTSRQLEARSETSSCGESELANRNKLQ